MSPAENSLHVLVYGPLDSGVTDSLRIGIYVEPLAALGVEVRSWQTFADDLISGGKPAAGSEDARAGRRRPRAVDARTDDVTEALRAAGLTALAWADVVLFRRWRSTHNVCTECETVFGTPAELEAHVRGAGHRTMTPDLILRPVIDLIVDHPELLGSRAIAYDTDDDVLDYPAWTGFAAAAGRERDLLQRILSIADLVMTATPILADRLAGHTKGRVRVVRNALDPAWYAPDAPDALGAGSGGRGAVVGFAPGNPRVMYHGVPIRLRDYEVARPAVDALAADVPSLRRVWLGAAEEPLVVAAMDEVRPWVEGLPEFAAALVAARPDIGLAPLLDEPFNRAKSELHWLEYALAGAPTIVSGFDGSGPFDPVRDGVDALVARTPADWDRHLRALAGSPGLRAEIAGRARERVLGEYTVGIRAHELAEIFRWAADHGGVGRGSGAVRAATPASRVAAPPVRGPKVLVIGPGSASASDSLRFGAVTPALAALGTELLCWTPRELSENGDPFGELESMLSWSDVIVLRRHYRTWHACLVCDMRTLDPAAARGHATSRGHEVVMTRYAVVRPLIQLLENEPGVLGERALVYETDDDLLGVEAPEGVEDMLEQDLVGRMLRLADLVTTTTPVLADRLRAHTSAEVRVVRNAIDPAWYAGAVADPDLAGDPRVVYHGVAGRLRDYAVARPALDELARERPSLRRVWLGSDAPEVAAVVDLARPWIAGLPDFSAALVRARPDIGIAPLEETPYNRGRSELHWLEYSMAGAPTVVSGFAGGGPYDVVRDGVDGLVAATAADWERHLRSLVDSRDLRAHLAGRARERVLADYTVAARAPEWDAAYRWAAEHAGIGRGALRAGD
jgi:glycosyltransferase involved in cell wall biosynthesis